MLLSYFDTSDKIEARKEFTEAWLTATLVEVDRGDDTYPYKVRFGGEDYQWLPATHVRKVEQPAPEPPKVKQYRFRVGTRWQDWQALPATGMVPVMHNYNAVQFREIIERTDAEIVARLRERGSRITMTEVSAIVAGNF